MFRILKYIAVSKGYAMARSDRPLIPDPRLDPDLTPEVRALMGVFVTFSRIRARLDEFDANAHDTLTDNQRLMLVKLDQPHRMGDLARVMDTLPSSLTAMADALEARGLVERLRDPEDRRAWLLRLTDAGRALRNDMLTQGGRIFREVTGLHTDDIAALADLTDKIRSHILHHMLQEGVSR